MAVLGLQIQMACGNSSSTSGNLDSFFPTQQDPSQSVGVRAAAFPPMKVKLDLGGKHLERVMRAGTSQETSRDLCS